MVWAATVNGGRGGSPNVAADGRDLYPAAGAAVIAE